MTEKPINRTLLDELAVRHERCARELGRRASELGACLLAGEGDEYTEHDLRVLRAQAELNSELARAMAGARVLCPETVYA